MRPSKTLLAALLVLVVALPVCAKKEKKPEVAPPAAEASPTSSAGEVVAYIGEETITRADVDKEAGRQLAQLRQQEFDIRRAALDKVLADRLYAKEAAARGVSTEELLKTEIEGKVTGPTQEEVSKFFEDNKAQMRGQTLEQISPQIQNYLRQQRVQQRQREFFTEVQSKYAVSVVLEPPRMTVAVRDTDPSRGPKDAPVTIVEFSDYQCPYCKRAHGMVEEIMKQYDGKVRLVFVDFPLQFHQQAIPAAEAAHCAGDQNKYWDYANNLMTVEGNLQPDDLKKRAETVGLDVAAFTACIDGTAHEARVKVGLEQGSSLGVTGTPTFFINGRMLVGAKPIEEVKAVIDDELARAAKKAAKG